MVVTALPVKVPPVAAGYVVIAAALLAVLFLAKKAAAATLDEIGMATGLKAAPDVGTPIEIGSELDSIAVAGRIVSPTSGTTVKLDDWTSPQYQVVVRLVANQLGTVTYKLTMTEEPPIGDVQSLTLGPYVQTVGLAPTLVPHMLPRLTSMLQGSPTTTLALTIDGKPESAVVYFIGT